MATSTQSEKHELNRFQVLRYDVPHTDRDGDELSPTQVTSRTSGSADMDVNGPGSIQSSFPIKPAQQNSEVQKPAITKPVSTQDEVEISPAGKMLDTLHQSSELRAERLAQIKSEIDAGTYETPDKLEAALGELLNEIHGDEDG